MPSWVGPVVIVVILLVIPVFVIMTGAVLAGILGFFAKKDVDEQFEDSEYLQLS